MNFPPKWTINIHIYEKLDGRAVSACRIRYDDKFGRLS